MAALLCLAAAALAQGKGRGITIRSITPANQTADPGSLLTLSFRVTDGGGPAGDVREDLEAPQGWNAIIPPSSFKLPPREGTMRLLAVQVPQSAPAGRYMIRYAVFSTRDPSLRDAASVAVDIAAVSRVALILEEQPDAVAAGSDASARLRIVNRGNAPEEVSLSASPSPPARVQFTPDRLSLPPGGTDIVTASIATGPEARGQYRETVRLMMRGREASVETSVSFDVLPRASGRPDIRQHLLTNLSIAVSGEPDGRGGGVTWSGSGPLDENGMATADFRLQRGEAPANGLWNWRSESRLEVATRDIRVRLGDHAFTLSRLTDSYRYGRGLGVDLGHAGSTAAGAYVLTGRWSGQGDQVAGAYASCRISERLSLRLNALGMRQVVDGRPGAVRLWSVEAAARPTPRVALQTEYARSWSERSPAIGAAWRLDVNGSDRRLRYGIQKIHAAPNFRGYYHDSDWTSGLLAYAIDEVTDARLSLSLWRQNLDTRPEQTAPRERLLQGQLDRRIGNGWHVSIGHDAFRRRDAGSGDAHAGVEQPWSVSVGRSLPSSSWQVEYRDGTATDSRGHTSEVRDLRLLASLRPSAAEPLTVYGGYRRGSQDGYLLGSERFFGASVAWRPLPVLFLSGWATFYGRRDREPARSQAEVSVEHILTGGRSVALRVLQESRPGERGASYLLTYNSSLDVALGRKRSIGLIEGTVYDAQDPHRPGIADAVVVVDDMAVVCDAQGHFAFPALPPGRHNLQVSRRSIGFGRITEQRSPMPVEVRGGRVTCLDIGVVSAARLEGRVAMAREETPEPAGSGALYVLGDPLKESPSPEGFANVPVEASDGEETLRRLTDDTGRFLFEGLRPGLWRVKVYGDLLPVYHLIDTPEQTATLAAGEPTEVVFLVRVRRRRIRMMENGDTPPAGPATGDEPGTQ